MITDETSSMSVVTVIVLDISHDLVGVWAWVYFDQRLEGV